MGGMGGERRKETDAHLPKALSPSICFPQTRPQNGKLIEEIKYP